MCSIKVITAVLLIGLMRAAPQSGSECTDKLVADISLILDESNSIWEPNFVTLRDFLADLVEKFPVSPTGVRFSAMTFAKGAWDSFEFDTYESADEVATTVRSINKIHDGGATFTHLALERFRDHFYPTMRKDVSRIVILVTDGGSTEPKKTEKEAQLMKQLSNVTVFVVGISNLVNHTENKILASAPADKHYFQIDSYEKLNDLLQNLTTATCNVPQDEPKVCTSDVVFTMASMSQNPSGAYGAFELVRAIVNDKSDPGVIRNISYGMVPSSCQLDIGMNLAVRSNETIEQHLDDKLRDRLTAVNHIQDMRVMFAESARDKVNKYAILVVDRPFLDMDGTVIQSYEAELEGIKLIVISVGKHVEDSHTEKLGSEPTELHKFTISDYSTEELSRLTPRLFSLICGH